MQSAVVVLLRHNRGFGAGISPKQRRMAYLAAPFGNNALDLSLEMAAETDWALHELPARHTVRTDEGPSRRAPR